MRLWVGLGLLAIAVTVFVCGGSAGAARSSTQTLFINVSVKASDGTTLDCVLMLPSGSPPAGGWPGVILFHGLGQSGADMQQIGEVLAPSGFASLACDARGTGFSGGTWGLDGPRRCRTHATCSTGSLRGATSPTRGSARSGSRSAAGQFGTRRSPASRSRDRARNHMDESRGRPQPERRTEERVGGGSSQMSSPSRDGMPPSPRHGRICSSKTPAPQKHGYC